jgi:hypothetical protein
MYEASWVDRNLSTPHFRNNQSYCYCFISEEIIIACRILWIGGDMYEYFIH